MFRNCNFWFCHCHFNFVFLRGFNFLQIFQETLEFLWNCVVLNASRFFCFVSLYFGYLIFNSILYLFKESCIFKPLKIFQGIMPRNLKEFLLLQCIIRPLALVQRLLQREVLQPLLQKKNIRKTSANWSKWNGQWDLCILIAAQVANIESAYIYFLRTTLDA